MEHLWPVDGGVEAPIEALQGFGGIEGRASYPQCQLLLGPPFDLIFEQAFEKLDRGPLALDALPVAGLPRGQYPGQPPRLQLRGQLLV